MSSGAHESSTNHSYAGHIAAASDPFLAGSHPVAQPAPPSHQNPTAQPLAQAATQPVYPAAQSTFTQPVSQPIAQPTSQPTYTQPVAQPDVQPTSELAFNQPATYSGHQHPVTQPAVQLVAPAYSTAQHSGAQPTQPATRSSQPIRFSRSTRPTPYPRPNVPPQPSGPPRPGNPSRSSALPSIPASPLPSRPKGPRTQAGDADASSPHRKRPREFQPNPNSGGGHAAPRAQVLNPMVAPGSGSAANSSTMDTALIDATRQLAQPRDTPGRSQHDHANSTAGASQARNMDVDADRDTEEVAEGLQVENDEILQIIYEGDGANAADTRLHRLVARLLQKQDAMCQTLRAMKESRPTPGDGSNPPPSGQPPRISPGEPRKKVNWDQVIPSTEPAGRQPRVARRVLVSKVIRQDMDRLLKLDSKKKELPPPPPAEIRYPTVENFGVRWEEMEKSLFNRMAANVVFEQVCRGWQADPLTKSELGELPGMISEHIRYLCRTWKNTHREDAVAFKKTQLKSASAASRRSTLYESRLKIIDRFPTALNMHRNLIIRLGLAGTSSDEEDPDHKGVYLIKRRPELSSRLNVLKSKLDLAYSLYCKGPGSKGSQMHRRVPSDKISSRPFWVEGLPITCLSRAWLQTLSAPEREFYQFEPHKYDYRFPDGLLTRTFGREPRTIVVSDDEVEDEEM